jgi:hypothetical protein
MIYWHARLKHLGLPKCTSKQWHASGTHTQIEIRLPIPTEAKLLREMNGVSGCKSTRKCVVKSHHPEHMNPLKKTGVSNVSLFWNSLQGEVPQSCLGLQLSKHQKAQLQSGKPWPMQLCKKNDNNKIPTVKSIRVCVFPYISTCVCSQEFLLQSS